MTAKQRVISGFSEIKDILSELLPKGKNEWVLLVIFFLFYFSYSLPIALYTSIIDNEKFWVDLYFAFDTPAFYHEGYVNIMAHPMLKYFTAPFFYFGNLLEYLSGNHKVKTVLFVMICCLLISASVVYINRYLKQIVCLSRLNLWLLTVFYGFMSTNLILSFSPESFTITAFLLTFTLYYYSSAVQNQKHVGFAANLSFALLLGGTTITNFPKGLAPMLFTEKDFKTLGKKSIIISIVFAFFVLLNFTWENKTGYIRHYNSFSEVEGSYLENAVDLFFGAPVLFPEITTRGIRVQGVDLQGITSTFYNHWWQYLFVGALLISLFISICRNRKNKLVQMILLMLSVDILIHLVARFGLQDPFIYGAHWIYCIPLLLGWLLITVKDKKVLSAFTVLIACLTVGLLINNIVRLSDFIYLAIEKFPV